MPLTGNLSEISLANLIQVNCQDMRAARLELRHQHYQGELYFSDGQVVHAVQGTMNGIDAVAEMLKWRDGTFVVENEIRSPEQTVTLPWKELLVEAMKQSARVSPVANQSGNPPVSDLFKALDSIEGVLGHVVAASDGTVLAAHVPDGDGESEAAVTVFVGGAADQIGSTLGLGSLERGLVQGGSIRFLVFKRNDRYIGLTLSEHASPALVATAAGQVLAKLGPS
jgi:predicted regulator of Ras-like GTPase activity (Roadblock/LC7/MglB family)